MITYIATNIKTGEFYIGSTKNFDKRKSQHLKRKINRPFQSSLRKNPENFIWHFVEDNLEEPKFEQILLDMYFGTKLCYNLSPKTDRPLGFKGRKHTEEHKRSITGENNPMFGVPRTKEAKKKISESLSGENHPQYGRTGALCSNSKAMTAIQPDGLELYFGGIREAARELGIAQSNLGQYLKTGHVLTRGPFKGWRFLYENL
jgi:group I intron endonuclease